MSLLAFVFYGADKLKAKQGAWRVPDKVLLYISFFGGAPGGILGILLFRHKTKHLYFLLVSFLVLALVAGLAIVLIFLL